MLISYNFLVWFILPIPTTCFNAFGYIMIYRTKSYIPTVCRLWLSPIPGLSCKPRIYRAIVEPGVMRVDATRIASLRDPSILSLCLVSSCFIKRGLKFSMLVWSPIETPSKEVSYVMVVAPSHSSHDWRFRIKTYWNILKPFWWPEDPTF